MIKVEVPKIRQEDVDRMDDSIRAIVRTIQGFTPIFATLLAQTGTQMVILARSMRTALETEMREREAARRERA